MKIVIRVTVLLIVFVIVENRIYLYNTDDGINIEYYDCVLAQSLFYCRRPRESIHLTRENDTLSCQENDGQLHRFSELRSNNVTVSTILHQWKSTLERVEQYSLFLRDPNGKDDYLCQCLQPESFGKNCEYRLPGKKTFEETLQWQITIRAGNPEKVQMYGDVVCYETLECDSGALCLDWREICDGIQHCLEGKDEENCDLLEVNQCDQDEYRCMNGMCIPAEFFLDGERDCLDWSDEMQFVESKSCPLESVSSVCDDHLCPPDEWSCGDGECIRDRLDFFKLKSPSSCSSGREQFFLCETDAYKIRWTMTNGRCFVVSRNARYEESVVANRSEEEECEHLLKCVLSLGAEIGCSCSTQFECAEKLEESCLLPLIPYPREAIVAPYLFFLFNRTSDWIDSLPNLILINGTMRCRDHFITVIKTIPFDVDLNGRRLTEEHFCRSSQNVTSAEKIEQNHQCHHLNESTDRCGEWNPCLSVTRLNDGFKNCLNGSDEREQTEMEMEKSCAEVRHHRFRCSREQPTCLSVVALGDQTSSCENRFDELWFGTGRRLSSVNCNNQWKDECSLLRQYIEQSSPSTENTEMRPEINTRFRSYCDTFWDLESRRDENPLECRQLWICSHDQFKCQTGQCVEEYWVDDGEWDCADASDEYTWLYYIPEWVLDRTLFHDFTNRTYFIPSTCPQSDPFLCLSPEAIQQGFSCFNLSQISDGRIDCAGATDERNTLRQCSQSWSLMLGHHFLCPSTNSCIPYLFHCSDGYRCPNRSDDQFWCDRQHQPTFGCSSLIDFVCFDGQCLKGGRCNRIPECSFAEDEYMCDYLSSFRESFSPYREDKRTSQRMKQHSIQLSRYPLDANVTELDSDPISIVEPMGNLPSNQPSSSPYWCNRGLGVLSTKNNSLILCFCPPHYYGEKCEYHQDRLSVLLRLDPISSSSQSDPMIVLQLLVLFLFNNQTLMSDHFHLRSSSVMTMKKIQTHFVYPHSSSFREERRERFFNRSDLLHRHPFSIRIELYRTRREEQSCLVSVWNYPILFDHLPVYRFAKVLRFHESTLHENSCSSQRRDSEEEGNPQCGKGYCALGSVCQPNSLSLFRRDSRPLCFCSLNRLGQRCEIEHSACHSNPCQNNGSCLPEKQLDQFVCLCAERYLGSLCQWTRSSIRLSLLTDLSYAAAVIQHFRIDFTSLDLILVDQHVSRTLPEQIRSDLKDRTTIPELVSVKLYSSGEDLSPDLYLLSLQRNVISLNGATDISPINRCDRLQTFSNETSPIQYHPICIRNHSRLCFRDDVYLCICADNHTRVECFNYDDQLDQCSFCLSNGRCLKGDPRRRSTDFLCLCPQCHSGQQCQFNTKSFSFTLDQLFSPELLSDGKRMTITLLVFFSLFTFFLALPNNLFSFLTLRRRSCLRQGVGHYLLAMSVINQLTLALLAARLIHLTVIITLSRSSPLVDDLFCKLLGYLLTCLSRSSPWLSSFVALERVYSVVFFNRNWFKQPHIARSLMFLIVALILVSTLDELVFVKSFTGIEDRSSAMCVIEYPSTHRSMWTSVHQVVSVSHFLFPLLINLSSTLTIMGIVIKNKMNIRTAKLSTSNEGRMARGTVFRNVFSENREMITRPAITLIPSIFSLFSLPFLIISFLLGCQNLADNPLRYVLITFYFIPFIPQVLMFYLYIYPSSFYWKQWQSTTIGQRITALRQHTTFTNILSLSTINEHKTRDFSIIDRR